MTTAQKLNKLRKLWKLADPKMRKIIECRARLLKMGIDPDEIDEPATIEEAETIFLGNHQTSLSSQS